MTYLEELFVRDNPANREEFMGAKILQVIDLYNLVVFNKQIFGKEKKRPLAQVALIRKRKQS